MSQPKNAPPNFAVPDIKVRLQFTKLTGNSNKFWQIEWYDRQDASYAVTTYGRIGTAGSIAKSRMPRSLVERKIKEKLAKGYKYIDLAKPVVEVVPDKDEDEVITLEPALQWFLEFIFKEAGEDIQSYLTTTVDSLSLEQIQKGRDLLKILSNPPSANVAREWVNLYFNTIPTKLPHKIDADETTRTLLGGLDEQSRRLDQLEAAVNALRIQQSGNSTLLSQLGGTILTYIPNKDDRYRRFVDEIDRTRYPNLNPYANVWKQYRTVKHLFAVKIPSERMAFDQEKFGSEYSMRLYHGSRSHNIRHILAKGLIVPAAMANGRRLGDGIYFSIESQRALNYTGSKNANYGILLLCDVKTGKTFNTPGELRVSKAPAGYHSVRGTKSHSGMDEITVYKSSQQTIRAIAILE